jgi:hypothetical protein
LYGEISTQNAKQQLKYLTHKPTNYAYATSHLKSYLTNVCLWMGQSEPTPMNATMDAQNMTLSFFHWVLAPHLTSLFQDSKIVPTLPKLRFIQLDGLQMGNGVVHSRELS